MKILCVIPSYHPSFKHGGPIISVHNLNKALVKKGIEVTVYTTNTNLKGKVPVNKEVDIDGVKVIYFTFFRFFEFLGPTGWQFSIFLTKVLKRTIPDFDLVYISAIWNYPTAATAYYCRKYKKPYIIAPRGVFYPYTFNKKVWKKWPYYKLITKRDLERAAAIHYTTQDEFEKGHSFLELKNKNVFIVPNGVDLSEFENLPPKENLLNRYPELNGKKVILFLSRLDWKKGLDVLAKAYGIIATKRKDAHLLIVGDGLEGFKNKVKKWFQDEGVLDRITFTGMLTGKEKLEAFSASDIFTLPSHSESFGMAIVEAMACGLPVVISDTVGIFQEVEQSKAGLIVPGNDAIKLSEAIIKLLDNEKLIKQMGENGRALSRKEFEFSEIADKMIKVFKIVLSDGKK
ncbi:MAG TPA: glycosyltransferase [Candidatus Wolfebacteria bacterium]|nr:glycosyltransferase [Candidatus Wolfebacteria bacterium]